MNRHRHPIGGHIPPTDHEQVHDEVLRHEHRNRTARDHQGCRGYQEMGDPDGVPMPHTGSHSQGQDYDEHPHGYMRRSGLGNPMQKRDRRPPHGSDHL